MKHLMIKKQEGYIYCLSNPCMPGIHKIGMTRRMPDVRAKELFTTGVASPFKIEFAKKVADFKHKEIILHNILSRYSVRVSYNREFFRISQEEVRELFDLIDGELWDEDTDTDTSTDTTTDTSTSTEIENGMFVFDVVVVTR